MQIINLDNGESIMKKILAIILTIACVLSLSACTTSSTTEYTAVWGKSDVYEVSTYEITVIGSDDIYFVGAPTVSGTGTYITTLSGGDSEGYTYETVLEFVGEMNFDGKVEDFTQTITSKMTFSGITSNLSPTYSEKSYNGTTIVYDAETGVFSSAPLSYTSTVVYQDGEAAVTIKNAAGGEVAAGIPTEAVYSTSSTTTYDNEQLALVGRALGKESASSVAFNVVDPVIGSSSVALYVSEYDEDTDTSVTMQINGVSQTFETYTVSTQLNSTFESGTQTLWLYAKDDIGSATTAAGNIVEVDRSRLLSFMHQVPYTSSAFSYNLVEFTSNLD